MLDQILRGFRRRTFGVCWCYFFAANIVNTDLQLLNADLDILYKLGVMALNCLHGQVPPNLVELCQPVADVASRQHLRSTTRHLLAVPRYWLSTYGQWAFSVAGPSVSNSLSESLRDPLVDGNNFRRSLKTFLFAAY